MLSHPTLHRREFLQVGASSLLGLGLPALLAGRAASASAEARQGHSRSVILVLLTGGMSHLDTLDMKPNAPAEIRGEFKPIATAVPGIQVCEHLPLLAAGMGRWALVRSLSHGENGHLPATHRLLTGAPMPNQRGSDLDNVLSRRDWPCYAAGLSYLRPRHDGVPSGVTLPHALIEGSLTWPGQHAGLLGAAHDPLLVTQDPNSPAFRMDTFSLPEGTDTARLEQRRHLLDKVDPVLAGENSFRRHQHRAFELLKSSQVAQWVRSRHSARFSKNGPFFAVMDRASGPEPQGDFTGNGVSPGESWCSHSSPSPGKDAAWTTLPSLPSFWPAPSRNNSCHSANNSCPSSSN